MTSARPEHIIVASIWNVLTILVVMHVFASKVMSNMENIALISITVMPCKTDVTLTLDVSITKALTNVFVIKVMMEMDSNVKTSTNAPTLVLTHVTQTQYVLIMLAVIIANVMMDTKVMIK